MWRFPASRTTDDNPPPRHECPQATADRAFIPLQGLHQLCMATHDTASGTLVSRGSPRQETLVQSRQTLRGHGSPPLMALP